MANRISSIRLGNHFGTIHMRMCSTLMNRSFLRRDIMPSPWMLRRSGVVHQDKSKSIRRVFSEKIPKDAEKVVGQETQQTWLQKFLSLKEMPEKYSMQWYREMVLICTVFAITGSSTMFLVSCCNAHCIWTNEYSCRSNPLLRIPQW